MPGCFHTHVAPWSRSRGAWTRSVSGRRGGSVKSEGLGDGSTPGARIAPRAAGNSPIAKLPLDAATRIRESFHRHVAPWVKVARRLDTVCLWSPGWQRQVRRTWRWLNARGSYSATRSRQLPHRQAAARRCHPHTRIFSQIGRPVGQGLAAWRTVGGFPIPASATHHSRRTIETESQIPNPQSPISNSQR